VKHLVRMIDGATSRSWGRFVWSDGTRENMAVLWEYVVRYGRVWTITRTAIRCSPRLGGAAKARSRSG
jgi:hypothetical protein